MLNPASRWRLWSSVLGVVSLPWCGAMGQDAPPPAEVPVPAQAPAASEDFPPPKEIPTVSLGPTLKTHPIRRTAKGFQNLVDNKLRFNEQWIDASVLPRDKKGIWVLDFAYRPLRLVTIEDSKGRRDVHYMYYQIINRTGEPRMFVPQFTLVTDTGKRYEDTVLPKAVDQIKLREDPTITKLYGAVDIMGMVGQSNKQGVEDAVFGVAIWEGVDPHADKLTVYVRGLSDGYRTDPGASEADKPVTRYKALKIDFIRRGDEHALNEREIIPADPAYDWTYR